MSDRPPERLVGRALTILGVLLMAYAGGCVLLMTLVEWAGVSAVVVFGVAPGLLGLILYLTGRDRLARLDGGGDMESDGRE
jgi:Flp pilus assembly protein TadB